MVAYQLQNDTRIVHYDIPFRKYKLLTFCIRLRLILHTYIHIYVIWMCFQPRSNGASLFSGSSVLCVYCINCPSFSSYRILIVIHCFQKPTLPQKLEWWAPFENYFVQLLGCWSEYSSIDPGALFLPAVEGRERGSSSLGSTQSGFAASLHTAGCDATHSVRVSLPSPRVWSPFVFRVH